MFSCIYPDSQNIEIKIEKCRNCAFCFINPRLTQEEILKKYSAITKYGFSKQRYNKYPAKRLHERADRISKLLLKMDLINISKKPSILDYGGAWGYNLLPMKNKAELYLIDHEKWELDKEIHYLGKTLHDIPPDQKFDCILYLHTLEHGVDPASSMKRLASVLSNNGMLYVEVPLGIHREIEKLGDPITHLIFFQRRVCTIYLSYVN